MLPLGTARRRAVLMVAQLPVGHAGIPGELPEAELGMALPENDDLVHRQSRRTFRVPVQLQFLLGQDALQAVVLPFQQPHALIRFVPSEAGTARLQELRLPRVD